MKTFRLGRWRNIAQVPLSQTVDFIDATRRSLGENVTGLILLNRQVI